MFIYPLKYPFVYSILLLVCSFVTIPEIIGSIPDCKQLNTKAQRETNTRPAYYSCFPGVHAFKMSVCEIIYSQQNRTFEVKCYLFQDDLRATLYDDPNNGILSPEIVVPYIQRHLTITINNQKQSLQLTSLNQKDEQILAQFTILAAPNVAKINNIGIQNSLLLEKFAKQINMVYVYYPNEQNKRAKMLDAQKNQDIFEF